MGVNGRITGYVKWWSAEKGYGFLRADGSIESDKDVFVHYSAIEVELESGNHRNLEAGQRVSFVMGYDDQGRTKALEVRAEVRAEE